MIIKNVKYDTTYNNYYAEVNSFFGDIYVDFYKNNTYVDREYMSPGHRNDEEFLEQFCINKIKIMESKS